MKIAASLLIYTLLFSCPVFSAENDIQLSSGQTIYVAIYSNVFSGPKGKPFNLNAMLSIRNTDLDHQLTIVSSKYFDNSGKELKEHAPNPITLAPLASHHFSITENDESGGFGANFIVRWEATEKINSPIVESIMIGSRSGQGISFVSQGKVIAENTK